MGIMWVFEIISGITSDVHESTWLVFTIYYYSKLTLDFHSYQIIIAQNDCINQLVEKKEGARPNNQKVVPYRLLIFLKI